MQDTYLAALILALVLAVIFAVCALTVADHGMRVTAIGWALLCALLACGATVALRWSAQ